MYNDIDESIRVEAEMEKFARLEKQRHQKRREEKVMPYHGSFKVEDPSCKKLTYTPKKKRVQNDKLYSAM